MPREGKQTKSQKKLTAFFEAADFKRLSFLSITDVAAEAGVAEATLLRFCRSMGYSGYSEFRLRLAQGDVKIGDLGLLEEVEEGYRAATEACRRGLDSEALQSAWQAILTAKRVSCFGAGRSYTAALELHDRLLSMGFFSTCARDIYEQNALLSACREGEVLVLFALSGDSREVREAAELARRRGLKVIVCGVPLGRSADISLTLAGDGRTEKIAQMFLVDVLSAGLRQQIAQ